VALHPSASTFFASVWFFFRPPKPFFTVLFTLAPLLARSRNARSQDMYLKGQTLISFPLLRFFLPETCFPSFHPLSSTPLQDIAFYSVDALPSLPLRSLARLGELSCSFPPQLEFTRHLVLGEPGFSTALPAFPFKECFLFFSKRLRSYNHSRRRIRSFSARLALRHSPFPGGALASGWQLDTELKGGFHRLDRRMARPGPLFPPFLLPNPCFLSMFFFHTVGPGPSPLLSPSPSTSPGLLIF